MKTDKKQIANKKKQSQIIFRSNADKYNNNFNATKYAYEFLKNEDNEFENSEFLESRLQCLQYLYKLKLKLETLFQIAIEIIKSEDGYPLDTTILKKDTKEHQQYDKWRASKTLVNTRNLTRITYLEECKKIGLSRRVYRRHDIVNKIERRIEAINQLLIDEKLMPVYDALNLANSCFDIMIDVFDLGLVKEGQWIRQTKARQTATRNKGRKDNLTSVLIDVSKKILEEKKRFPTYKEVLDKLEIMAIEGHPVIQGVSDTHVSWITKNKGLEYSTSIDSVRNRLTRVLEKHLGKT